MLEQTVDFVSLLQLPPYSLSVKDKLCIHQKLAKQLSSDLEVIVDGCRHPLENLFLDPTYSLPLIPVSAFKDYRLTCYRNSRLISNFKVVSSSGTSGRQSYVHIDPETSKRQIKVLNALFTAESSTDLRLPMLCIDSPSNSTDEFSAGRAAISGFGFLSKTVHYALDIDGKFDKRAIEDFYMRSEGAGGILFAFTYNLYRFMSENEKYICSKNNRNIKIIHGGGWKKLVNQSVSKRKMYEWLKTLGFQKISDYYGMVEQLGSIFFECSEGYFHSSNFNEIHIYSTKEISYPKTGLALLFSVVPTSYPGNLILSEDIVSILGEDSCSCGRRGRYFVFEERVRQSAPRGCSDAV